MLIDTPGMIDSPVPAAGALMRHDRGYDFSATVRWFAEKADVVLLFFDPDKVCGGLCGGVMTSCDGGGVPLSRWHLRASDCCWFIV